MSVLVKNIHIEGKDDFPCPVGRTVAEVKKEIRSEYGLLNGGIRENDVAIFDNDIITEDGEYRFVNFQLQQQQGNSSLIIP